MPISRYDISLTAFCKTPSFITVEPYCNISLCFFAQTRHILRLRAGDDADLPMNVPESTKYAAHIFDCDGTLTDSMPLHAQAWTRTMKRHGIEFSRQHCYSMAGMPTVKIIEILAEENGLALDAIAISEEKEAEFFLDLDQLQPIEYCLNLVREFVKEGVPISVASGSTRPSVDLQLKQIGLDGVFDIIVTAEDTERHKPEPDVFLKAAELMKVAPEKCLVYEDSDFGIQAAISAGMGWIDVRKV